MLCCYYLGVPRETTEERDFADFDIFDDPESPFSTFNFRYPNEAFKRMHDLMEFNTLNNIHVCTLFLGCREAIYIFSAIKAIELKASQNTI